MAAPEAPPPVEVISAAEERFARWRRTAGLFLGPLVFLALYSWPPPGLEPGAQVLAAILGLVVVFWVTESIPLPVTALLGAVLCVVFGVAPADKVLAPFADKTIFLFLGSFLLAEAMAVHGLNRRFAYAILASQWVGGSAARLLFAFGA